MSLARRTATMFDARHVKVIKPNTWSAMPT